MITERLMRLGDFTVPLREDTPSNLYTNVGWFDHIVVTDTHLNADLVGDTAMLAAARYVGVVTKRESVNISGQGLGLWLGDSDGKGTVVLEAGRSYSAASFADVIDSATSPYGLLRDDSGAQTAIHAGTIYSIAGSYTGEHRYESQLSAIRYVCDIFDAEYRINPDGTIDVGTQSDLFVTVPKTVVPVAGGFDPNVATVVGDGTIREDAEDLTSRVVLLGGGQGDLIASGTADAGSFPYKDLFGNPAKRVRLINEAETSTGNATARAQLQLNRFVNPKQGVELALSELPDRDAFNVGDTVWVYHPARGLVDLSNEVHYRGDVIWPVALRVLSHSFPLVEGMGVYHRDLDGNWTDLTRYVNWESGFGKVEVGEEQRRLFEDRGGEIISGRVNADDSTVPDVPTHTGTPWGTSSYQDAEGRTRARIVASWSQPLNTDGSTIVDGDRYEIRWRRSGETDYQYSTVAWGTELFLIQDLSPGVTYQISVQAVDTSGHVSGFGTDESVAASGDTTAPSTPAAPTVAGNVLNIQVSHDLGKSSGGSFNLESDLDHLNVYASTTSGFTPSEANRIGQLSATAGHLSLGISVVGTFLFPDTNTRYVKVTAVDGAGNESAASAQASVTAELIDTQHITNLAVTTALIDDLAVTDAKVNDLSVSKLTAGTINTGDIIVTSTMKSSDYVAGSAGWLLDGAGNAELNDLIVRGDIFASVWDGGSDLSTGPDTGATAGFFLDSSAGAGQFEGGFYLGGDLLIEKGGAISGQPSGTSTDHIEFYVHSTTGLSYLAFVDNVGGIPGYIAFGAGDVKEPYGLAIYSDDQTFPISLSGSADISLSAGTSLYDKTITLLAHGVTIATFKDTLIDFYAGDANPLVKIDGTRMYITDKTSGEKLRLERVLASTGNFVTFWETTREGYIGYPSSSNVDLAIVNEHTGADIVLSTPGDVLVGANRVLTTADEGPGNGLDADTVDGSDASAFATSGHNHNSAYISIVSSATAGNFPALTAGGELVNSSFDETSFVQLAGGGIITSGSVTFNDNVSVDFGTGNDMRLRFNGTDLQLYYTPTSGTATLDLFGNGASVLDLKLTDGRLYFGTSLYLEVGTNTALNVQTSYGYLLAGPQNTSYCHIYTDRTDFYFNKPILINGGTVWHSGNDGSGSGLDADKLDTHHASYFAIAGGTTASGPNCYYLAGTVFQYTSSFDIKKDITPLAGSIPEIVPKEKRGTLKWSEGSVLDLTPVVFHSIADADDSETIHMGFLAEDLEEHLPEAVHGESPDVAALVAATVVELQRLDRRIVALES